jgi:fatty acid desaturase
MVGLEWYQNLDLEAFARDMENLREDLKKNKDHVANERHLRKIVMWSSACWVIGAATMWMSPNIITVLAFSLFTFSRWTMIAHHTCHGGYDKRVKNPGPYSRFKFALGSFWRRWCDWFDWMLPEAWNLEHNHKHHFCLGEVYDPDLVELNMAVLRTAPVPTFFKLLVVGMIAITWKWFYYATNTFKELKVAEYHRQGKEFPPGFKPSGVLTVKNLLDGSPNVFTLPEFLVRVGGAYLVFHFILFPLPLLYFGPTYFWNAIINLILAELLTNLHSFAVILPNHTGDDMYFFSSGCEAYSPTFYLRQVISSVDMTTGGDLCDFLHGFLNYQIEHHLFPDISMLEYQQIQPRVKEICIRHGVPYVQENVFIRVKKTVDVMIGRANMLHFPENITPKGNKLAMKTK